MKTRFEVNPRNLELMRLTLSIDNLIRKTERALYESRPYDTDLDINQTTGDLALRALNTARDRLFELSSSQPDRRVASVKEFKGPCD